MTNKDILKHGFQTAVRSQGSRRGFTALIVVVAAVVAVALGVGAYILVTKPDLGAIFGQKGSKAPLSAVNGGQEAPPATPEDELNRLSVDVPDFDLSLSSLPALGASAFNVSAPAFGSGNLFRSFKFNGDFSYAADTDIAVPTVKIDVPTAAAETPVVVPPDDSGSGSSGTGTDAGSGTTEPPPQSQVNVANCAQFSQIPAKSYCSMVGDANGRTLCEQCKDAGL